jgi:hypothetical protein
MVCPSCGAQIDSPGKFCAKCGAQLPEAQAPVQPSNDFAAVPPPPQEEPPAPPPWDQTAAAPAPTAPVEVPVAPVEAPVAPVEAPAAPAWAQTPAAPPAAAPAWSATPVPPAAAPAWPQAPAMQAPPTPPAGGPQYPAPQYPAPQYPAPGQYPPQYPGQYPGQYPPQYGTQPYAAPLAAPAVAAPAATGAGMLAPLLALAGGAVAIGSAWLPWAVTTSGDSLIKPIEQTSDTSDLANGYYLIAAGAVAAVCGLVVLLGLVKTSSSRMLMSLGAVAGGAVVLGVEFVAYNHVNDLTTGFSIVSMGYGLYLGAGAGVAAAVGGLLGLVSKR